MTRASARVAVFQPTSKRNMCDSHRTTRADSRRTGGPTHPLPPTTHAWVFFWEWKSCCDGRSAAALRCAELLTWNIHPAGNNFLPSDTPQTSFGSSPKTVMQAQGTLNCGHLIEPRGFVVRARANLLGGSAAPLRRRSLNTSTGDQQLRP